MSKFGRELIDSLKEAAEHARGGKVPGQSLARAVGRAAVLRRPRIRLLAAVPG